MKVILLVLSLTFFLSTFAQTQSVDSLLGRVHNNLILMDGDWIGPKLSLKDSTVGLLISKGKGIARKLIVLLDNRVKGIAAHFILTMIYRPEASAHFGFSKTYQADQVLLNQLLFYIKREAVFTLPKALKENKIRWVNFLKHKTQVWLIVQGRRMKR